MSGPLLSVQIISNSCHYTIPLQWSPKGAQSFTGSQCDIWLPRDSDEQTKRQKRVERKETQLLHRGMGERSPLPFTCSGARSSNQGSPNHFPGQPLCEDGEAFPRSCPLSPSEIILPFSPLSCLCSPTRSLQPEPLLLKPPRELRAWAKPFWKAAAKTQPVPPWGSHSCVPGETASAALLYRAGAGDRKTHRHGTTPRSAAGREARQRRAPSCCAAGHPALQPVPSRDFPASSLLPPGREAAGSSPPPSPTPHRSEGCHLPTSSPASHQHRTMVDVALLPRREERDRRRCPRSSAGRSARRCGHGTFRCPRRGSGPRLQRGAGSEAVTGFRREVKKKMIFKKKKKQPIPPTLWSASPHCW